MNNIINLTRMSFSNLKYLLKQIWFIWAMWIVVPIFNPIFLNMLFGMIVLLITYQIISYEDMNGIDNLIAALPVKRNEYVTSRYLIGIISILIAITMTLITYFISSKLKPMDLSLEILLGTGITTAVFAIGIIIPAVLKYGVNKGKIISVVAMAIVMIPTSLIQDVISKPELMKQLYKIVDGIGMPLILTIVNIIVLAVSMGIAIKIYDSKEIK